MAGATCIVASPACTGELVNTIRGLMCEHHQSLGELSDLPATNRGVGLAHGERQEAYGHPFVNFTRIGRMWGGLLGIPDIPPNIVAMMLQNVKQAREVASHQDDNLDDVDGYNECHRLVRQHPEFTNIRWDRRMQGSL